MNKIGIDIIEIKRIQNTIDKFGKRFLNRVFTVHEQRYCLNKMERYAARFAVKEAVIKVIETWIPWKNIEVIKCQSGAIKVNILHKKFQGLSNQICISLTHSKEYAAAVAMYTKN